MYVCVCVCMCVRERHEFVLVHLFASKVLTWRVSFVLRRQQKSHVYCGSGVFHLCCFKPHYTHVCLDRLLTRLESKHGSTRIADGMLAESGSDLLKAQEVRHRALLFALCFVLRE